MSYVDEVLEVVRKKNADQPEFLQAVTEVLESLRPCIDANEELYKKNAILERITEPDRQLMFRVPWVFSHGEMGSTPYRNSPGVSRSHIHRSHPQYHCGSEPLQLYLLNNTTVFLYSYQRILSDSMVIPCSTTSE